MSKKSVPTISFDISSKSSKKFVIFELDQFQFGVPVEQISQVVNFEKVFNIPNTPNYVLGVINLRGKIVSLVHLAKRLGLSEDTEVKTGSQVLFVDLGFETVGMLIDRVVTLKDVPQEKITDNLDLISSRINMEFLKGAALGEGEEDITILLNLDMVLTEYEIQEIIDSKQKLKDALEAKEKLELSDEDLMKLNLDEDDFSTFD